MQTVLAFILKFMYKYCGESFAYAALSRLGGAVDAHRTMLVERPSRALSVLFWLNQARDTGFQCLGGIGGYFLVRKYPADRGRGKKNAAKRLVVGHGIRQFHNRCAAELTMLFRGLPVFHALV